MCSGVCGKRKAETEFSASAWNRDDRKCRDCAQKKYGLDKKQCSGPCGELKPESEFSARAWNRDDRQCLDCAKKLLQASTSMGLEAPGIRIGGFSEAPGIEIGGFGGSRHQHKWIWSTSHQHRLILRLQASRSMDLDAPGLDRRQASESLDLGAPGIGIDGIGGSRHRHR